jgi:hypothetical protein
MKFRSFFKTAPLTAALFVFCLLTFAEASSELGATLELPPLKNRPEGFGGLVWGDPPEKLDAGRITFSESEDPDSETHTISGEGLAWGDFQVNDARLQFRRGKLVMVHVWFIESTDTEKLVDYAMEQFEKPSIEKSADGGGKIYLWDDEEIAAILNIYPDKLPRLALMHHGLARELSQ